MFKLAQTNTRLFRVNSVHDPAELLLYSIKESENTGIDFHVVSTPTHRHIRDGVYLNIQFDLNKNLTAFSQKSKTTDFFSTNSELFHEAALFEQNI